MAETSKKSKEKTKESEERAKKSKERMAYIRANFRQKMGWSKRSVLWQKN